MELKHMDNDMELTKNCIVVSSGDRSIYANWSGAKLLFRIALLYKIVDIIISTGLPPDPQRRSY